MACPGGILVAFTQLELLKLCTGSLLLLTATVEHTGLAKPVQDRGQWEFPPPVFSQGAGVLIG